MLYEGHKMNLIDPAEVGRQKDIFKKYKRQVLKDRLLRHTPVAIGAASYGLQAYLDPKVNRMKWNIILRDLEKRDQKAAKQRAKMDRRYVKYGLEEGWRADFFGDKIKPHLMKNKTASGVIHKYGPRAQKLADFYYGNQMRAGHYAKKFATEHPVASVAAGVVGSILAKTAVDVGSHWLSHKMKMKDPNYEAQTRANAEELRRRRRYGAYYEAASEGNPAPGNDSQHTSPNTRSVIKSGHTNPSHKYHHAHVSILRGMAIDKVNTTGLAGKKFNAGGVNKTNTTNNQSARQTADVHALDNLIEDSANRIYEGIGRKLLRGAGRLALLGGAFYLGSKAAPHLQKHWADAKPRLKQAFGADAQKVSDYVVGNLQLAKMKWDRTAPSAPPEPKGQLVSLRRAKEELQRKKNMKVEDIASNCADTIHEVVQAAVPVAAAGLRAVAGKAVQAIGKKVVQKAGQVTLKSAGKALAKEAGSRAAGKAVGGLMNRRRKVEDIIDNASAVVYEGWGGVVAGALKSGAAKEIYKEAGKAAGTAAAQGIGRGVGNRVGQRIERGSYRQQKKMAKQNRKLNKIDNGRRWSSYDPEYDLIEASSKPLLKAAAFAMQGATGGFDPAKMVSRTFSGGKPSLKKAAGLGEDVAPAARSPFEINRVKNAKDWYHYQRNAYIDAAIQKAKQYAKQRGPNKGKVYGNNTTPQQEGLEEFHPDVNKLLAIGAIGIAGAGATKYLWKRRNIKARRKLHAKKANYHRGRYNRHAAYVQYADTVRGAKKDYTTSLGENLMEMGYVKAGKLVKQYHIDPMVAAGNALTKTVMGPYARATGKKYKPGTMMSAPSMVSEESHTERINRENRKKRQKAAAEKYFDRMAQKKKEEEGKKKKKRS